MPPGGLGFRRIGIGFSWKQDHQSSSAGPISKSISSYVEESFYSINNQRGVFLLGEVDFFQVIHIFFSSEKKVNLKREICLPLGSDFVLFRHVAFSSRGGRNLFRFNVAGFHTIVIGISRWGNAGEVWPVVLVLLFFLKDLCVKILFFRIIPYLCAGV